MAASPGRVSVEPRRWRGRYRCQSEADRSICRSRGESACLPSAPCLQRGSGLERRRETAFDSASPQPDPTIWPFGCLFKILNFYLRSELNSALRPAGPSQVVSPKFRKRHDPPLPPLVRPRAVSCRSLQTSTDCFAIFRRALRYSLCVVCDHHATRSQNVRHCLGACS